MVQFTSTKHRYRSTNTGRTSIRLPTNMQGSAMYLLLLALVCRSAVATPLRTARSAEPDHARCTAAARQLLTHIKKVFHRDADRVENSASSTLFHGFNCTDLESVVNPNTKTADVCQPSQYMTCSGQRNTSFSETECLKNIEEDLWYYESRLTAYNASLDWKHNSQSRTGLIVNIINSIKELRKNCSLLPKAEHPPENWPASDSFEDRKTLCKQLKGFHVRAITMNRALGYICAGDYQK